MKVRARFPSVFAIALCAFPCVAACTATRHDEPKTADKKPESVPAAVIVPMKVAPEPKVPVTLHVGDAAPALSCEQWIQGQEFRGFEAGKVYVVEFWATWCPPCVRSIPHINKLQHDYPKVVCLGIAGSERPPEPGAPDTRLEDLHAFIAKQGDKMTYRVAYDSDRSMSASWMQPAGQDGIPCAFIIGRDSHIAWIGHPMAMEAALANAVATK